MLATILLILIVFWFIYLFCKALKKELEKEEIERKRREKEKEKSFRSAKRKFYEELEKELNEELLRMLEELAKRERSQSFYRASFRQASMLERAFYSLGVPNGSDLKTCHAVFREKAKTCHPDLFNNVSPEEKKKKEEEFKEISGYFKVIEDYYKEKENIG